MAHIDSCPCQGLNLVREMAHVTALVAEGDVRQARQIAPGLGRRIITHLNVAAERVGAAKIQDDLDYIRLQNNLLQSADEPLIYLDNIRDRLHTRPVLQQVLVCDNGASMAPESEVVQLALVLLGGKDKEFKAMGIDSQDPLLEAQALLDESINTLCSK